ncbi:hypothetical protein [Mycolicibacterium litorale]|uniref:hypothetical protein n=1 Tax=Mycolicibacterium litorale TaxID=758802 RepID=UPI001065623A|nr:hypothetical protein [Mycolicibacterium litorale]MCV7416418.1 hypothetical protein [Mycolicibacterium litorale]
MNDDTAALRAAYEAALSEGGGAVELTRGRFYIPGNVEMSQAGVSLLSRGGAVVGGGEVRVGPASYDGAASGVDFSGDSVAGLTFDGDDDYGTTRCLVLRNTRGLDISQNLFRSAGKGVAVEAADGNEKFHTTAMVRVSGNRFTRLTFGVYGDTEEWDCLSDWQITDNYFNFCSDTSVWIASTNEGAIGGVDGLNFAGNTIFSLNHSDSAEPLFAIKRYNLRLGKTNWLRIINNNFFEAGLSAVYLDTPANFSVIGNHIAWPGQRELADALEIHHGAPKGVIEGNTFAMWTRAAVGLHDLTDLRRIEIGGNSWAWTASPDSWTGSESLPGYRIYASQGGEGYPTIRDFQDSGAFDNLYGEWRLQSRDIKSPKGGVSGASHRNLDVSSTTTVFSISDIVGGTTFGGLISVTATNTKDPSLTATYLLFVSSAGSVCTPIAAGGHLEGADTAHPSFTWALGGEALRATPVGATAGTFDFDAVALGAASPF